jgi:hypothetical protein
VNLNDPKEQSSTPAPTVPVTIGQRFLDELKTNMEANRQKTMPKHLR